MTVPLEKIGLAFGFGENGLDELTQVIDAKWLDQDRARNQLRRPIGLLGRRSAAHQNDAAKQPRPTPDDRKKKRITCHLRKAQVKEHEIELRLIEHLVRRVRIGNRDHPVVKGGESPFQGTAEGGLIIDDEYVTLFQEAT